MHSRPQSSKKKRKKKKRKEKKEKGPFPILLRVGGGCEQNTTN